MEAQKHELVTVCEPGPDEDFVSYRAGRMGHVAMAHKPVLDVARLPS